VELGRRAKHLTTTAKVPHQWQFFHDETGYNYRLPNINAALGLAQLEELPLVLSRKKALTDRYREAFRSVEGVRLFEQPSFADSNYWLNALVLDGSDVDGDFLQKLLLLSNSSNLQTRPLWEPMHTLPMYASCPKMDLSIAESLRRRVLTIPSGSNLST
jgi:perosamine synthetase